MRKRFKELSASGVNIPAWILTGDGVRLLTALSWFVAAFLAGAALFLATRPAPVLHALVLELKGVGLIERCRQAGACAKSGPEIPPPRQRQTTPPDMDRG